MRGLQRHALDGGRGGSDGVRRSADAEPDTEPYAIADVTSHAEPHAEPNPVAHACVRNRAVPQEVAR